MTPDARRRDITRLPEIWDVIQQRAPRDTWIPIDDIYAIVEANVSLRAADFDPAAPRSRQTKWERNVRNVLQHQKTPTTSRPASILWDAPTRSYLLPRRADALPSSFLADADSAILPDAVQAIEEDPFDAIAAASLTEATRREWRAIKARRGAPVFRAGLLEAYRGKCAVTSTSAREALEAAHIVPYRGEATNHLANGLLLRADVHTLFDLGLVAVNPFKLTVEIASGLSGTDYESLEGACINLPRDARIQPSQRSLLYHYERSRVLA